MCGIAGVVGGRWSDPAVIGRMLHALRHRGPDDGATHGAQWRGAGPSPALDHRPRGRPAADRQRGRHQVGRLQRRDLQLPGADGRAGGQGPPLPHPLRHRGRAAPLRGAGRGLPRPAARHVRLRDLGYDRAAPVRRPRPSGPEALLLPSGRQRARLRLRDQGPAAAPGQARGRRLGPAPVSGTPRHRPAAQHVPRHQQAAAGALPELLRPRGPEDQALLGPLLRAQAQGLRG